MLLFQIFKGPFEKIMQALKWKGHSSLDIYFRVGYFAAFLVFNLIYWVYYITVTQHKEGNENDADD